MTSRLKNSRLLLSRISAVAVALALSATVLSAQGSVSNQGFGYPLGQMSTRALGTGGALGEIDPRSPLNPASILFGERGDVFGQYDPEIRNVKGSSGSSRTVTARFSNFGINLPVSERIAIGFSGSTLLDRSWSTNAIRQQVIGVDTVTSNEIVKSEGGITDLRYAIAYSLLRGVKIGLAGHHYTGRNNINLLQQFPDSFAYGNVSQTTSLNYSGNAVSAGVVVDLIPNLGVAISGRKGGQMKLYANDTVLATGHVPDHYAASLTFTGISGTTFGARYAQDNWSSMTDLSTSGNPAQDATEFNVGLETNASQLRGSGNPLLLRLGARWRTLPFLANGQEVKEVSYGGGVGIPIARNRAGIDLAVVRSNRTGVTGVKEGAFNLSFGIRINP